MKKCLNCNVEMVEGNLYGKPRFIDMDHDIDKFYFNKKTGEKGSFLGISYDKYQMYPLYSYMCPKCGKIDIYADINNKETN